MQGADCGNIDPGGGGGGGGTVIGGHRRAHTETQVLCSVPSVAGWFSWHPCSPPAAASAAASLCTWNSRRILVATFTPRHNRLPYTVQPAAQGRTTSCGACGRMSEVLSRPAHDQGGHTDDLHMNPGHSDLLT